ncbi:MAG TPA: hypothetical protein VHG28_14900 [Longimicrobiaceae bacterium]|nr:hypothetical protein [Longimicrobiaceae bacterium]
MSPHLAAALGAAAERIPPERIDLVWVFPARQAGDRETGLAVLAVYPERDGGSPDRRGVWTLRYEAVGGKGGKIRRVDSLVEQAVVPAERVERVIEGVLRRLGTETEVPRMHGVEGERGRWAELLAGGGIVLDADYQE